MGGTGAERFVGELRGGGVLGSNIRRMVARRKLYVTKPSPGEWSYGYARRCAEHRPDPYTFLPLGHLFGHHVSIPRIYTTVGRIS
jgi:hypothetical protein